MSTSSFTFTSKTTDFTTHLSNPINLIDKKYEVALVRLETFNSFPNIIENVNNIFRYSPDNGTTWKEIRLDTGSYEINDMNIEIARQMTNNGDYDVVNTESYINIIIFASRVIVIIKHNSYKVDFSVRYSIGKMLGFPEEILTAGFHKSPDFVDANPITSIFVHVDIVTGSYLNGRNSQIIYTFAPAVRPGAKIIEAPSPLEFLPIYQSMIHSIRIWLTDEDNKSINNIGEDLIVRLSIKEIVTIEESFINAMEKIKE